MKTTATILGLLLPLVLSPAAHSRPEGALAEEKPGTFPSVEEVKDDEKAKALRDALEEAVKSKEEAKIVEALAPMITGRHESFVDPLKKLAGDRRDEVAAAAVTALGSQGEKKVAKVLLAIVKQEVRERGFLQRTGVKAAAIESLGRLGVDSGTDLVLRTAEAMMREPEVRTSYARVLVRAAVRYFGLVKEKKAVSFLVEHVDEPQPEDPNSGTNPPAEYWKARHEIWNDVRGEVVWALKEITGREMETGRRWKAWLEDEGRKLGMK